MTEQLIHPQTLAELGALADAYAEKRKDRLAIKKQMEAVEVEEQSLKKQLMEAIRTAKATAVGGKTVVVTLKESMEPTIANWDLYYAHIRETGSFELLYRRANPAPLKERKDIGVNVPGVEWFPVETLSISTIK